MSLTIGSLFSGIGGLELGLEWAGLGPVLWQVEQDEYCRAVLAKHWPNAIRFHDVREVGASNLPTVDVICGGFPCQDISVAGRRAGLAGARSGLFYEFARIIREVRPRYAVLENVTALLADGLDAVLGELAESGYDAEWDCIPASSVGAPHQRDRIFILAYPASDRRTIGGAWDVGRDTDSPSGIAIRVESGRDGASDGTGHVPRLATADAESKRCGQGRTRRSASGCAGTQATRSEAVPNATGSRLEGRYEPETARSAQRVIASRHRGPGAEWWSAEPDVGRVAHGVPARVDRLRALGNAVVPQVAEIVGQVILAREAAIAAGAA